MRVGSSWRTHPVEVNDWGDRTVRRL